MISPQTLARRVLGPGSLLILAIVASSPLTVTVAGVPVTFAPSEHQASHVVRATVIDAEGARAAHAGGCP